MRSRPKIKIALTLFDKILEAAGWICLAALWVLMMLHFNSSHIKRYWIKDFNLRSFAIATTTFLLLTILNKYPYIFNYPVKITNQNAYPQYLNATRMIRYLKLSIILMVLGQNGIGSIFLPFYPWVMIIIIIFSVNRSKQMEY